ncbi:D-alanyl-D-alanine carboxypeptidase family protein [Lyticum sinuosum]|uniref:serine-type D-Ala-D-Ala carboxypeptidase n=1 Tax=Lyticum sinuosum TaxID=1332059 RepID=A0AAE4VJJ0_9RICK|nr:D-alanyl-D-alanine carboxypeptidase family protein [Lyticum sinuosum]MDZ5760986.1 DacC superfamily D-alanyl-D-alanine carboxypeptidase [Lyticum sinuosum]
MFKVKNNLSLVLVIILSLKIFFSFKNEIFAENKAKFAILADYNTGAIIYEKNADEKMFPSSMTKIMTTYLLFSALDSKQITLDQKLQVSTKASSINGSKMFIKEGSYVRVDDIIRGIIVQSGNDACIALSENLSGTESAFVEKMNLTAEQLGMKNTKFVNSSGWPNPEQVTTARDLAILSKALIHDFPQYYHYHSEKEFKYNNILQQNRNSLLSIKSVDGIKTGRTELGGYGVAFSAKKDGYRIIGVINGLNSAKERHESAAELISFSFNQFTHKFIYKSGDIIGETNVIYGNKRKINAIITSDITVFIPKIFSKNENNSLNQNNPLIELYLKQNIKAPIKIGDNLGYILFKQRMLAGNEIKIPVVANENINKGSFIEHLAQNISFLVAKFI